MPLLTQITSRRIDPLLVAPLSGDESAPDFKQLSALALRLPAWILASQSELEPASLKDRGFEAVLFRPIDMSDSVRRAKQRLKELGDRVTEDCMI